MLELVGRSLCTRPPRPAALRRDDHRPLGRLLDAVAPSPSWPFVLVGIAYTLVPAGRGSRLAKVVVAASSLVFALAPLYLGDDHPFDIVVGVASRSPLPLNAFRFFTPNEVFPVAYRRARPRTSTSAAGAARRSGRRCSDQLGLTVVDIKPVGLEGSGGSTPLRLHGAPAIPTPTCSGSSTR